MACGAVLLEPHVLHINIIQLGPKIFGYHRTVAIPIHSNGPVLIITGEDGPMTLLSRCWLLYLFIMKWQTLLKRNVKRAARIMASFVVPVALLL